MGVIISPVNTTGLNPYAFPPGSNVYFEGPSIFATPNLTSAQMPPGVFATLPIASQCTVINGASAGATLATIVARYTANVHPYSTAVTGKSGFLCLLVGDNDYALMASGGVAAYITSLDAYIATAKADLWTVIVFTLYSESYLSRLQYDYLRLPYNDLLKQDTNIDRLVDLTLRFQNPGDTTLLQDGAHPTVEGARELANIASEHILSGIPTSYGKCVLESATWPSTIMAATSDRQVIQIRNALAAGLSCFDVVDHLGVKQGTIGWGNSGNSFFPSVILYYSVGQAHKFYVNSTTEAFAVAAAAVTATQPFIPNGGIDFQGNGSKNAVFLYHSGNDGIGAGVDSAYGYQIFTANQTGSRITFGIRTTSTNVATFSEWARFIAGRLLIGTTTDDTVNSIQAAGDIATVTAGKTFKIKSGSNAKAGTFTLVAGAATVANTSVTANSVIVVTLKTNGGTRVGNPDIVPTASTGFVATGAGTDTSTYNYVILEVN